MNQNLESFLTVSPFLHKVLESEGVVWPRLLLKAM